MSKSTDLNIKRSRTGVSNRFKIVVIGLPNTGTTNLIHRLLNKQYHYEQTKRFKVYHCTINTETLEWKEEEINDQTFAKDKSCARAVIFEVIVTRTILELLYLLISPEDIILLVYDPLSLNDENYVVYIKYILNLVSAHCKEECCSSAINARHFPVVLMVGLCNKFISYSRIANFFREYCHGQTYQKHILHEDKYEFHFIDENRCTYPVRKMHFLTKAILTAAEPLYNQPCISNYLKLEQTILKSYKIRSFLSTEKVSELADQAGIETTKYLFEHLKNKGIILYYPKVKGLLDKMFVSPQRLINLITSIFELPTGYTSPQELFMQRTSKQQKLLAYLLENLNLAVAGHWSISEISKAGFYYDDTPYLIPSLVQTESVSKPESYVGVIYYFPDNFVPKCVFYQLMVKLISWFHSDENVIKS